MPMIDLNSPARMLEQPGQLLLQNKTQVTTDEVCDSLVGCKQPGTTGLGHGVAIPHGCAIHARCNNQDLYELLRLWEPDRSNA